MEKIKYSQKKTNLLLTMIFIASILILTSCEEVIEIDLNSSNPVLVAEGQIVKDSTAWIKLSYTSDYFNADKPLIEESASVVLSDDNNNSEELIYIGNGIYEGRNILGETYENYTLNIKINADKFEAHSTLMPPSEIYDIIVSESEMQRPRQEETTYSLEIKFKDISKADDFYMIKIFINGLLDGYALVDDKIFLTGDTISYPLIRKEFYENEVVNLRLHTVDEDTYNYYKQLNDAISDDMGPGGSSTPYNPYSNFGENVLGYFVAWSYVSDSVLIQ